MDLEGWRKLAVAIVAILAVAALGLFDKISGEDSVDFIGWIFSVYVLGNVVGDHLMKRIPKT